MQVNNCPNENMGADVLTKPLQGAALKKMRAYLMNCSVDYEEYKEKEISSTIESLTGEDQVSSRHHWSVLGVIKTTARNRQLGACQTQEGVLQIN